jgi:hypothetical protein
MQRFVEIHAVLFIKEHLGRFILSLEQNIKLLRTWYLNVLIYILRQISSGKTALLRYINLDQWCYNYQSPSIKGKTIKRLRGYCWFVSPLGRKSRCCCLLMVEKENSYSQGSVLSLKFFLPPTFHSVLVLHVFFFIHSFLHHTHTHTHTHSDTVSLSLSLSLCLSFMSTSAPYLYL